MFSAPTGGWTNATQTAELTASDGAANDFLGFRLAVSGSTIAAGGNSEPAVYVFSKPSGPWANATQTAEFIDSNVLDGPLALSGSTLVAGAPRDEGAVYAFAPVPVAACLQPDSGPVSGGNRSR